MPLKTEASRPIARAGIWYSGLRPPGWPPFPSEAPSIWVDWPKRGGGEEVVGVVEDVEEVGPRLKGKALPED